MKWIISFMFPYRKNSISEIFQVCPSNMPNIFDSYFEVQEAEEKKKGRVR